jgi:hypothetical protein
MLQAVAEPFDAIAAMLQAVAKPFDALAAMLQAVSDVCHNFY